MNLTKGWWVVAGGFFAQTVNSGLMGSFMVGIFMVPVIKEFGWDRTTVSAAIFGWQLTGGLGALLYGAFIDRYGPQKPTVIYLILYCLTLVAVSFVPNSRIIFIALFTFLGLGCAASYLLPYAKAVAVWFDDRRGIALGVVMAGAGFGATFMPQYSNYFVNTFGWRGGFIGFAIVMAIFSIPPAVFLLRYPPKFAAAPKRASQDGSTSFARVAGGYLRTSTFWLIAIPLYCMSLASVGTLSHLFPFLTDRGDGLGLAATTLSIAGLGSLIARLIAGWLMDRYFAPYVAAGTFLTTLCGLVLLLHPINTYTTFIGAAFVGVSVGAEGDIVTFLASRYFPFVSYGRVAAMFWVLYNGGSASGTFIMGRIFDVNKSYALGLEINIALCIFGTILLLLLKDYVYPQGRLDAFIDADATAPTMPARPIAATSA